MGVDVLGGGGGAGGAVTAAQLNALMTHIAAGSVALITGGTTLAPTVDANTLDVIAATKPPAADWSNNGHKITNVAGGVAATDAANVGQITGSALTAGSAALVIGGTALAPTVDAATLDVIAATKPPVLDWSNNAHKITGLAAGVAATDAANVGQVGVTSVGVGSGALVVGGTAQAPTVDAAALNVIAATKPPVLDWSNNGHKITGLAAGVAATDAANVGQLGVASVTAASAALVVAGTAQAPTVDAATLDVIAATKPAALDWSNNGHKITSVATGTAATDAANVGQIGTLRARVLDEAHADAGAANTAAEQTLATLVLPAGVVAVGDTVRFAAFGDALNNSAGAVSYTWRFKIGATTVMATSPLSQAVVGSRWKWTVDVDIQFPTTASERVGAKLLSTAGSGIAWATQQSATSAVGYGTAAEDTAAALNVILTCQLSAAAATADVILHGASLILTKK